MKTIKHTPALNAPCYSNPEGVTHSFENDSNGKMISVIRTYSTRGAKLAMAAPDLLSALKAIIARIDGVYDDPDLMNFGGLSDKDSDIKYIASVAIAKAGGKL